MWPLNDETMPSAEEHVSFQKFVFSVFVKDVSNVVALISDNCIGNRSISKKWKRHLSDVHHAGFSFQ